jgi:hypothetical protein
MEIDGRERGSSGRAGVPGEPADGMRVVLAVGRRGLQRPHGRRNRDDWLDRAGLAGLRQVSGMSGSSPRREGAEGEGEGETAA